MKPEVAPGAQHALAAEKRLRLAHGHANVYRHASDIEPELWATAFADTPKDFHYYQLLEQTMRSHFDYRYLLVFDETDRPRALQPLILATQDLAASAGERFARLVAKLRLRFARFFQSRMVLAGCLVGEGKTGLIRSDETVLPMVVEALEEFARSEKINLLAFKDFPAATREALSFLGAAGYVRLAGFPSLTLNLDFASFEEYMKTRLSKATRKSLRRKLRVADTASPPLTLEVLLNAKTAIDEIYPLYLAVAKRSDVHFEIFTREYFLEAGRMAPGKFRYFVWRQGGRAVAFSFCTIWSGTIHDNDIGFDYSVAHELNLYYVTFRDLLNWALNSGLHRYASAPFNYDPKLRLRLELQPVDLYVKHTSPVLNSLIRALASVFEPARSDPTLRRQLHLLK
jgi:Acetyltransferase (GNAT) domain